MLRCIDDQKMDFEKRKRKKRDFAAYDHVFVSCT